MPSTAASATGSVSRSFDTPASRVLSTPTITTTHRFVSQDRAWQPRARHRQF
jgi:hypothetical protein